MGPVPTAGPRGDGGTARDGSGYGEGVEEDDQEAADGGDEPQRESQEDAAGGGAQQDVVAE